MTPEQAAIRKQMAYEGVSYLLERKTGFSSRSFSPLEHQMRGSTPWMGDTAIQLAEVDALKEASLRGDMDARRKLLTPIAIQEQGLTPEVLASVQQERARERKTQEEGDLTLLLDEPSSIKLGQQNAKLYCEPSDVDDNGQIGTKMKVYLLDKTTSTVIKDENLWQDLAIDETEKQWFSIEQVPHKNYRLLVAHVVPEA